MRSLKQQLPPLDALVVFDASARTQSFTKAATELNVTQAAVSRQIKILEADLGVRLFIRSHRKITLSQEGRDFQHSIGPLLMDVARAANQIRNFPSAELTIGVDQAIAALWLTPRLTSFRASYPEISLRIIVSDDPTICLSKDIDLAIMHGDGIWTGHRSILLFPEEIFPVCSPTYMKQAGVISTAEDLAQHVLIDHEDEQWNWMNWRVWLSMQKVELPSSHQRLQINNYATVIQSAREGLGVALGWGSLVDELIDNGDLTIPVDLKISTELGYHLLIPNLAERSQSIESFVRWSVDQSGAARTAT